MKSFTLLVTLLLSLNLFAINIAEIPSSISIDGDNGGMVVDGSKWDSSTIKDKVYVMFYVDPDEKDTNSHFSKALKAKKFDREKFGSIAVINLAATWKPNFILEAILKEKQKEFPHTIYVKDKKSVLVKEWSLDDQASDILIFSKDSSLLFYKSGRMSKDDIEKAINIIEANL